MITQERALARLSYDAETGYLVWKPRVDDRRGWNKRYAGRRAGSASAGGYVELSIDGEAYLAHRIIWLMVHGEWPDIIDHIDRDRLNNRLSNLRNVGDTENARNASMRSHNSSGATGVYWGRQNKKWIAQIVVNRKTIYLGGFDTVPAASAAYQAAKIKYHPDAILGR